MDWQEAKRGTIKHWLEIRDSIESEDEVQLLTDINMVSGLCEAARAEAAVPEERCEHCHFYQQFGGCQEVSWKMTKSVTEGDWDGLRALVDQFFAQLEEMDRRAEGQRTNGSATTSPV